MTKGVPMRRHLWVRFLSAVAVSSVVVAGCSTATGAAKSTSTTAKKSSSSSSGGASTASSGSAPGVTSSQITIGAISTLTGPIAADFNALVPGAQAYFDMVNAQGGINGRKLSLAYNLDDGGNPSQFSSLARTLVNQDHVFAAIISSPFFSPTYFKQTGTPTYGYNVVGNWAGPPNLFASGGSVLCYSCGSGLYAYFFKQVKGKSIAVLAYNVSSSSDACSTTATMFKRAGGDVSYEDLNVPIDGNVAPDVQRIEQARSDVILSCMDVTGNISMARAAKQYGLKVTQLWLNGNDQSVIDRYQSLMQNAYFLLTYVPPSANPKYYPGLAAYLSAMKRYEPGYLGDALAIQGWTAAALLAEGVKAAGRNLTQQRVVQLTNQITNDTGGGISTVTNWKTGHTEAGNLPSCGAFVKIEGTRQVPVFGKGHQVFVCIAKGQAGVNKPTPVTPPAGTPGT